MDATSTKTSGVAARTLQACAIIFAALPLSFAQAQRPLLASDDLTLRFHIKDNRAQFHLGELIPIEYEYTAIPERYLYVTRFQKLEAGQGLQVTCTPEAEPARDDKPRRASTRFSEMLLDPQCQRVGIGGGSGGGCGDCDTETPLREHPLRFESILNRFVRFRHPGTYTCTASSAQVEIASPEQKPARATLVQSQAIKVTITDDPEWSHAALLSYTTAFEKNCRIDHPPRGDQCFDITESLNQLDTPESLASIIRLFYGRQAGWETGFWDAIQSTSHQDEALRLMTARIQQPDMQVSTIVLSSLAMWALRAETADAFNSTIPANTYHSQALEHLRRYVRLLGTSLAQKNPEVLSESLKTYQLFAEQRSCSGETLIPESERQAILLSAQRP